MPRVAASHAQTVSTETRKRPGVLPFDALGARLLIRTQTVRLALLDSPRAHGTFSNAGPASSRLTCFRQADYEQRPVDQRRGRLAGGVRQGLTDPKTSVGANPAAPPHVPQRRQFYPTQCERAVRAAC